MKKTFSIYILALLSFIGSINTLLQTEEKTTTLDEALSETDCEPDCIYKYPYLQNDHVDVQEKLEPTSIETIQPSDSQTPIQPEQSPSEVLEEGEERFILESEACYKFDLRVEEEPAPKDEACYEIVIPPPTVVVVKGSDLQEQTDSPLETQVIPENNGAIPYVIGESEGPLPETPPLASQNQQLASPLTVASQPFQTHEQPPIPFNAVPQPQEVVSAENPLGHEVSPLNQDQGNGERQAPSYETAPQNQDMILPLEEIREPSTNKEQPPLHSDAVPQPQERREVLSVEPVENTLAPQNQQENPPPEETTSPLQKQEEMIPPPTNEQQGPPPDVASFAPQYQQEITSEGDVPLSQNPNESLPRTIESQTPPPEAVPFIPQNPEVIPPPEETTGPYETQELPLLPPSTAPQPREGSVEIAPQVPEEIPPSDRNQEQPPVSQEQELPPNDTLVPQSNEQSLPIQTHEEIPPRDVSPPSDERVAIPPPTECEVVSNDHPEVVVIVERPESVNIHYGETQTSPDRAAFGRRRQQFPLQEGWGDRYPNEEFDNPSQDAERGPEILPGFEQEPQVESVPSPELEERKPIGNQVNNGPEYPESLNRIGEARQGEQELIPFEEGQALESNGQEIGLPPRIPADIELPPFIREESFEIEGIPAENHEGINTPDQITTVNPEPPLPSSGGYKDASELESFGSPSERPEDTLWQDRREEIPFEQGSQEVTNSGQEIPNLHPSVPINQEIQPDVIEGQFENEGIPVEENQGVVHYDEEVYHQDEDSPLNPEIPSDLKGKANLRGYPSVEELQRGNPQDQREHAEPLNESEDIVPYYGGEHVEPEAVPRQPEGDFIPFEAQEVINYDEEAYNNPQQDIPPEIEREIKEAIEYVSNDRISTGTTQIYGQPTTYLTYETYDRDIGHEIAFTYVLTNIYSGIFKTDDYHYVVYGAGALNFYNSHYGPQAEPQDTPSCSCNCNYQGYTFNYSFNL